LIPYSLALSVSLQRDKAMALGMMHDLQPLSPFKRRVRKLLQRILAARRKSPFGENEFFRKAVRRHELFWLSCPGLSDTDAHRADCSRESHEAPL